MPINNKRKNQFPPSPPVKKQKSDERLCLEDTLSTLLKRNLPMDVVEHIDNLDENRLHNYSVLAYNVLAVNSNSSTESTIFRILNTNASEKEKLHAIDRFKESLACGGGGAEKASRWVENFLRIPFGKYAVMGKKEPVSWLEESRKTLDNLVFGNKDVKQTILEYVAKYIRNPLATSNVICLHGEKGVGKTTIVGALSKIMNRPVVNIALGGIHKAEVLIGHDYTYVGSNYGKVVSGIIDSEVMNPIFAFDELDKVARSGSDLSEVHSVLTHLVDPSQHGFNDLYMDGINFDMKKSIFIFTLNDLSKIDPILLDRMVVINMKSYTTDEVQQITTDYTIPKILKNYNLTKNEIIIPETFLKEVLLRTLEPGKLHGVRQIEHTFAKIIGRANYEMIRNNKKTLTIDNSYLESIPNKKEHVNYSMYT